ncbi:M10 family metallopeptidase C-terminal domain-containing protein [soil metagenome]
MAKLVTLDTITLSEFDVGTINPVYTFEGVLGGKEDFVASFEGEIVIDPPDPTSPAIAFDRTFQGPVDIEFSSPISKIEFDAGVFNEAKSTKMVLYGRNGFVVEKVLNGDPNGTYQHFSFDFGENVITRVRFSPVGDEPAGYAVDNITIGLRPESRPVELSGNAAIDGLLCGTAWNGRTVTYSFLKESSEFLGYGDGPETFPGSQNRHDTSAPFNSDQKAMARSALGLWDDVASVKFQAVDDSKPGMLRLGVAAITDNGDAFLPGDHPEAGDVKIKAGELLTVESPGSYAYFVFVHEIGHALGLKHPHDAGNPGNIVPPGQDSLEFSIMSYRSFPGAPVNEPLQSAVGSLPQTMMMNDIAAIQYLYGANFKHHSGNDRYVFDPGQDKIFETIWDGGGADTYDASHYRGDVSISLIPGKWSVLAHDQLAVLKDAGADSLFARGSVFNAYQYQGDTRSLIENAIGGDGDDRLTGNLAKNHLTGGDGKDILDGLQGGDFLEGSGGRDSLFGGSGNDLLIGGAGGDEIEGGGGDDRIVFGNVTDSRPGAARDVVTGFIQGGDTIVLSGIDARAATSADNAFKFIGDDAFTGAGQLRFFTQRGQTVVAGNVNADLGTDFQFAFDRAFVPVASDFLL